MSGRPDAAGEGTTLACYCFEIPEDEVTPETVSFVRSQVASGKCACRRLNPSGRCCLPRLGELVTRQPGEESG